MIKYYNYAVTLSEIPDEITLCFNISNCPCHCEGCSEKYLWEDVGEELTLNKIVELVDKYKDITCVCFMGGDNDINELYYLLTKLNTYYTKKIKLALYSGREYMDMKLLPELDYYKIGRWIIPKGKVEDWSKTNCGPIEFPFSNQLLFKNSNNHLENITYKFRQHPIGDLNKRIIHE